MASKEAAAVADLPIKVLRCYCTKSGSELATLFDQIYAPNATFADPFAVASPRREAILQFLSLQHFFDSVEATASSVSTSDKEIKMDVHFKYVWARNSWLSKRILPEVSPIDATVVLEIDENTGKIVSHTDDWRSPETPKLPTMVREFNVKAMNAVFRLLGWEKELRPGMASGSTTKTE